MRIMMVAQFYAPTPGGEERMVQVLSEALVRRGHHVCVATLRHSRLPARENIAGVTVYRIQSALGRIGRLFVDSARPHAAPAPDPEASYELRRVFDEERPDVVHAHNWLLYSLLPLRVVRKFPLVVSLHDYSLVCATKRLMRNGICMCAGPAPVKCLTCASRRYGAVKGSAIAALAYPMGRLADYAVDLFLPVSKSVAQRTGINDRRIPHEVISNFVPDDPEVAAGAPPEVETLADGYILFVGDATTDKGIEPLLEAYGQLRRTPPLVLIGRPLSRRLETLPANVIRVGPLPHASVLAAYRHAGIVVVPPIWPEPFGLTAIEAMSMGRPIIATRAGALPEIVTHGKTGLLVSPGDVDALRGALATLLRDDGLRQHLGENAYRRSGDFRASAVIPRFERAYQRAIRLARGGIENLRSSESQS
jgi:glycosyltransferase involved in cell wall biosynthesis